MTNNKTPTKNSSKKKDDITLLLIGLGAAFILSRKAKATQPQTQTIDIIIND